MSTGGSATTARSVGGKTSVSTGGSATTARSVGGKTYVSTGGSAIAASLRSMEGKASVSTGGKGCGGKGFCDHGRRRTHCKDCVSVYIGIHWPQCHRIDRGGIVDSFTTNEYKFLIRNTNGTTAALTMPALRLPIFI